MSDVAKAGNDSPAKKTFSKEEALAAYNDIVQHASLLDLRLVDLKFKVKHEYFNALSQAENEDGRLEHAFESDLSEMNYDESMNLLIGKFLWSTRVNIKKKKVLSIDAEYYITYSDVPPVDRQHLEAYMGKVGRFATYPYFRGLVSHLSWESSAELPIMPVLK
ncbi:hypothetical protein DTW90_12005 [Neorhizobium sp. P12A]|uniref:hypothetical protein n=1 Tax=Neorhizobium sp. P12A TaxID=2268027 RepID=UPI0011ECAD6D|nr:hypothetical protein [Neorhizobium sp. P12A]KAA0698524.1 hypothetical protein DTW90_12005 [Neorhizobium sp. P12A]